MLGEELQITCTATNDEDAPMKLKFSWSTPNDIQFNVTITNNSHTATSTLHISTVTHNHGGVYQCIVRNDEHQANNVSVSSTVIVEGKNLSLFAM